jgi:uncharacterized protein YpmB
MNKNTTYIIVAVIVVVIIVAGVAAFLLMNNGGGEPTPTATPTASPVAVADATSLKFTVNEAPDTANALVYTYAVNNFNKSDEILRVDIPAANYILVVNLADSTSASSADGGATWTAGDFNTDVSFATLLNDYATTLETSWDGSSASVNYTDSNGVSGTLADITVNPTFETDYFKMS